MSIAVMNRVWAESPTSGNQRLVLLAIADACSHDDGTGAWPSVDTIRRKANISDRTARRVIAELERDGRLIVHRGKGPHSTNMYTVVFHNPCQSDPCQSDRGVTGDRGGVTQLCQGGSVTAVSPNPPRTTKEPPPPRGRARDPVDNRPPPVRDGGGGAEEVFAALGEAWPLSGNQCAQLAPTVAAAVAAGWRPGDLAAHIGANPGGVRSPYAVLRTRLADLPNPPASAPPRPPWCGSCDPDTRHLEDGYGRPARCPTCHPLAVGGETA